MKLLNYPILIWKFRCKKNFLILQYKYTVINFIFYEEYFITLISVYFKSLVLSFFIGAQNDNNELAVTKE